MYLTNFGLFEYYLQYASLLFGLQEKKVIVYLQKIEWLAYIIVQFIS